MTQYVCDNCGSTVTDEQFCPSCGAWVDPMQELGDHTEGDFEEFSLGEPPPEGEEAPQPLRVPRHEVPCPSCGSSNPINNRHCEECGARLSQGALPVAPRPAVQATAGVRAAMAIAALLVGVVLIALLFNIFVGGDDPSTTTVAADTTTTTAPPPESGPIDVLSVNCSVPGLSGLDCSNLIDGGQGEYQINWETLEEGESVTIDLIFAEPMVVTGFVWENLPEGDRFYQNYRAQAISVVDGTPNAVPLTVRLDDEPGAQVMEYASFRTLKLSITVETVYFPQERNSQIFTELAVLEIQPLGYPAGAIATTTTTTEPTDEDS